MCKNYYNINLKLLIQKLERFSHSFVNTRKSGCIDTLLYKVSMAEPHLLLNPNMYYNYLQSIQTWRYIFNINFLNRNQLIVNSTCYYIIITFELLLTGLIITSTIIILVA